MLPPSVQIALHKGQEIPLPFLWGELRSYLEEKTSVDWWDLLSLLGCIPEEAQEDFLPYLERKIAALSWETGERTLPFDWVGYGGMFLGPFSRLADSLTLAPLGLNDKTLEGLFNNPWLSPNLFRLELPIGLSYYQERLFETSSLNTTLKELVLTYPDGRHFFKGPHLT